MKHYNIPYLFQSDSDIDTSSNKAQPGHAKHPFSLMNSYTERPANNLSCEATKSPNGKHQMDQEMCVIPKKTNHSTSNEAANQMCPDHKISGASTDIPSNVYKSPNDLYSESEGVSSPTSLIPATNESEGHHNHSRNVSSQLLSTNESEA